MILTIKRKSNMDELNEKSVSKSQHRLMGQAYGVKKWKKSKGKEGLDPKKIPTKYRKSIIDISNRMTMKQLKDFAETKETKLPNKVDESKKSEASTRYVPYLEVDSDTPISKKYKNLHGFSDYRDYIKKGKKTKKDV